MTTMLMTDDDRAFLAGIPDHQRESVWAYIAAGREHADGLSVDEAVESALHDSRYDNPRRDRAALRAALRNGVVRTARVALPERGVDAAGNYGTFGRGEHQAMCAQAAAWLDAAGRAWRAHGIACRCPGGIADIRTVDGKLTVEVGHTKARKILACLDAGFEVLMVPYDTHGRYGVLLTPEAGHEHLLDDRRRETDAVTRERDLDPFADLSIIYARAGVTQPDEET